MDIKKASEICDQAIISDARNDALWFTKRHLEGFRAQKQYVANLEEDISDRYDTTTKMVTTYGERIGHSAIDPLHPGAILAGNQDHQGQKRELIRAKRIVERLEKAISDLPEAEKVILQKRYIDSTQTPWSAIALEIGYDVSNCYRHHNCGLRSIAISLCGIDAVLMAEQVKNEKRKAREMNR